MSSNPGVSRRSFLAAAGASALAIGAPSRVLGANDEVVLGIIGTGGRGQTLLKQITNIPNARIAAICDLKEDRLNQAAEICADFKPAPKKYSKFEELLSKEKLDGCIVATEVGNHAKCVIPVLESGIPCFSEKPMDCSVEKVDAIVKAARKAKGFYQVGFQRRYAPAFQAGVGKIHEGAIGDVSFMQGCWHWEWEVGGGWVADIALSGGEIVEQACHHMDVMNWVMKGEKPLHCVAMGHISGEGRKLKHEHESEDQSSVTFIYSNGAIFSYTHLFFLAEHFRDEKLVIHGKKGGIDLRGGKIYPRPKGEPITFGEEITSWELGTDKELIAFVDQIRNNKKPLSDQETGRISTLMSLMAHKAMYDESKKLYEPKMVKWADLGTTTDL